MQTHGLIITHTGHDAETAAVTGIGDLPASQLLRVRLREGAAGARRWGSLSLL